jgi:hypothetical protein
MAKPAGFGERGGLASGEPHMGVLRNTLSRLVRRLVMYNTLDRTTTKAQKMEKQYDLSRKLSHKTPTALQTGRSMSMIYMIVEGSTEVDEVIWYSREVGDIVAPARRPEFPDKQDDGNSGGSKKRKVRRDKSMDVASMLNSST